MLDFSKMIKTMKVMLVFYKVFDKLKIIAKKQVRQPNDNFKI